jgi:hypothetical protein
LGAKAAGGGVYKINYREMKYQIAIKHQGFMQ